MVGKLMRSWQERAQWRQGKAAVATSQLRPVSPPSKRGSWLPEGLSPKVPEEPFFYYISTWRCSIRWSIESKKTVLDRNQDLWVPFLVYFQSSRIFLAPGRCGKGERWWRAQARDGHPHLLRIDRQSIILVVQICPDNIMIRKQISWWIMITRKWWWPGW